MSLLFILFKSRKKQVTNTLVGNCVPHEPPQQQKYQENNMLFALPLLGDQRLGNKTRHWHEMQFQEIKRDRPYFECCKLHVRVLGISLPKVMGGVLWEMKSMIWILCLHTEESCVFIDVNLNGFSPTARWCLQGTITLHFEEGDWGFLLCDVASLGMYCIDAIRRIVTKSLFRTALPFPILNGSSINLGRKHLCGLTVREPPHRLKLCNEKN